MLAEIALGSVMVTVVVVEQLFASVTVHVYVPAPKPLAVVAVPPLGAHEYVNVPVPPDAATVADPFDPPLQEVFV